MKIEDIIEKIKGRNIKWRGHASRRVIERNIKREDIIYTIMNGEIIKEYPEDFPFPSCLILGFTDKGYPLHSVCSIGDNNVWIITVYEPDLDKWESDFKTRKENI